MALFQMRKRKIEKGVFISQKTENDLNALQKKKTVFMLLSTLFFAIAIFIPFGELKNAAKIPAFLYTGVIVYAIGIVLSVIAGWRGRNKHKLRTQTDAADAPRFGYKRFTYITYELFTWWHAVMLGVQTALAVLDFSVFTVLFAVSMALSLAFAVVSRQILWNANKDMLFKKAAPDTEEAFYQ